MPFQIIRNDITKMETDAIVNTANARVAVGDGCDRAVYRAAGQEELLAFRRERIGEKKEGDVFMTPGFRLPAKYIIHAVSPLYLDGTAEEEKKLRACYRNSLSAAQEMGLSSIAFPLISTGSYGYPKEEGMRIAVDEIHAHLLKNDGLMVYLVVFDEHSTRLGSNLYPDLQAYIDRNYIEAKTAEEYKESGYLADAAFYDREMPPAPSVNAAMPGFSGEDASPDHEADLRRPLSYAEKRRKQAAEDRRRAEINEDRRRGNFIRRLQDLDIFKQENGIPKGSKEMYPDAAPTIPKGAPAQKIEELSEDQVLEVEDKVRVRLGHIGDTFSEYLLYLIEEKGMQNADVYKRAIVDKKVFSKIKNNPDYHPQKLTALCLCIGAQLNLDETLDLLSRAGYTLSPSLKTDVIFRYFIEHEIYDMIELDILLEEYGQPCVIA